MVKLLGREIELSVKRQAPKGKDQSQLVELLTRAIAEEGQHVGVLSRPEEWISAMFGPGMPIPASPLDALRPDGLPNPRQSQYPVYWNVPGEQGKHVVPWEMLRKAAESPLFRACIEVRKSDIQSLDWTVAVSSRAVNRIAESTGHSKEGIERELRQKYKDEIDRGNDFWEVPDRKNDRKFTDWIGLLMEEHLTHDAMAIYPQKTYGGELQRLMYVDGSTIKCLLDEEGGRPAPPFPAYQQILYGFPRNEFTADTMDVDGKTIVPGGLTSTQLHYERRVQRLWTPYGFSATEQALLDGMLWSKRFQWMVAEYTEGAQPVQWIINRGTSDWSPRQLLEYERAFNDRYSGQTGERFRNPVLPDGLEPVKGESVPDRYKPDYDLFLIKLVAMHFMVTMPRLGFSEPGGLGSSGYHEGTADVQYANATLPDARWLAGILSQLQRAHLKLPAALEFRFLGLDDEDEASSDEVNQNRVASGRMTINEDRARLGFPASEAKEANMLMLQTQRGLVFIDGSSEQAGPGILIEPASEKPMDSDPSAPGAQQATPGQGSGVSPTQRRPIGPAGTASAKAEIAAFRKWAGKSAMHTRTFKFDHLTEELALELGEAGLIGNSRCELAKAANAGPKASPLPGQDGSETSLSLPSTSPYSS